MKKFFTLLLISHLAISLPAANFLWTGGASGDWNVGTNWNQSTVPGPADFVQFNVNATVFNTGPTPVVSRLVVGTTVNVTLNLDLTITSATELFGIQFSADNGVLSLGNGVDARTFTVNVSNPSANGIRLVRSGSVLNVSTNSTLDITQSRAGIFFQTAPATLNNNGTINISNYSVRGIRLANGVFNNNGTLVIGTPGAGSLSGIRVETSFNNNAGGTVTVNKALTDGILVVSGGTLTNAGTINTTVEDAPVNTDYGIDVSGTFTNQSGGIYNGDGGINANGRAFSNAAAGTVSNLGTMIFTGGNPLLRIINSGSFTNEMCARVDLGTGGRAFQSAGSFTNNGYIETTFTHCIQTNAGPATNNSFYTSATGWAIAAALGMETDNGTAVSTTLDAGGTCMVDFSSTASGMMAYNWAYDGTAFAQNGGDGVLDLTGANFPNLAGPHLITISDAGCDDYNSEFTVSVENVCALALPVELISFTAKSQANAIMLEWATISEVDNDHFSVEKLIDSRDFVSIGTVQGAGNSFELNEYKFVDSAPVRGINYYRLKQMDTDGHYEYSKVVAASYGSTDGQAGEVLLYPNPVSRELNIRNGQGKASIYHLTDSYSRLSSLQARTCATM